MHQTEISCRKISMFWPQTFCRIFSARLAPNILQNLVDSRSAATVSVERRLQQRSRIQHSWRVGKNEVPIFLAICGNYGPKCMKFWEDLGDLCSFHNRFSFVYIMSEFVDIRYKFWDRRQMMVQTKVSFSAICGLKFTKVWLQCRRPFVVFNAVPQLSIACFVMKIVAIKYHK